MKCKDCIAVQEAEQNPDTCCDLCAMDYNDFQDRSALAQLLDEFEEQMLKEQE